MKKAVELEIKRVKSGDSHKRTQHTHGKRETKSRARKVEGLSFGG